VTRTHRPLSLSVVAALALLPATLFAQAGETVRIAFMEPLSGPFANVGQNVLRSYQFVAEQFSQKNAAGVKFEVVAFDNKGSPQESLNNLQAAIAQGVRYVAQGGSSAVAAALIDAVNKHNERNPGHEVVYLNHAAVDPALTNERCSFWHFRLDADTSMKMEALTSFMKDQPAIKKVYLINQNYAHGQQVSRYFRDTIARKRPDVAVVGDDLHPIGQVKDFAPFVSKIKASGADAVVTGNWGQDLTLLIKAAKDAGLDANFYTYYASNSGVPTALAGGLGGKVRMVGVGHNGLPGIAKWQAQFQKRFNDDWNILSIYNALALLSQGMAKARSTDPVKVAAAMSGLRFAGLSGEVEMRKTDHQLQQTLYIAEWAKATPQNPYSVEGTGFNFQEVRVIPAYQASTPTSCQMKRP
jgi:branched-chain amino acid transport system substrate-binding protein